MLYIKGLSIIQEDEWAIAVVSTRRATKYGTQVTERLTRDLAKNGITLISGLTRGIDSVAHQTALAAGGRTMAVFTCGLDIVYPAENMNLSDQIVEQGDLINEYPLGIKPKPENFPRRNRILSGLSLGVLVIEARERSSALITTKFAAEQNREVFAVPGSIFSVASDDPNRLIQDRAKPILQVNDILEESNFTMVPQQLELVETLPANETESVLLK